MPIVRANRKDPYTHLYNETIRDKRLSFKARGLLAYMLSMSDGWEFHTTELVKQSEHDGIDSIKSALKELETCGYIRRGQERTSNGKFGKQTMKVYDTPAFSPQVEKPLTGKPSTVQPLTDNPPLRTNNNKNYQLKKKNNAHSSNAPHSLKHDFELLWNLYPKKKGKQKAFSAYKRAIKNGTTNKEIQTGIVNYLKEIKLLKTDDQFIKYGSTWFNNRNWEDDYQTSPEPQGSNQSQFTDQVAVTRRNEFVFTIYSEHQPNLDDAVPEIQRKYPELSELVIKQILWPEKYGDPGGVTNGNQQISSAN